MTADDTMPITTYNPNGAFHRYNRYQHKLGSVLWMDYLSNLLRTTPKPWSKANYTYLYELIAGCAGLELRQALIC